MSGKAPNHGTKVTDPHSTIQESSGPVTSDSLAAESKTFQSANRNAEPLGVSGSNSTFTTTDTSGATELPPAHDASARLSSDDRQGNYSSGVGGQDKAGAVEPTYHNDKNNPANSNVTEAAPTYVDHTLNAAELHDNKKPKGKNLHEVEDPTEFDRAKNASFTTDIGSEQDPGRLAEKNFAARNAENAGSTGATNKDVQKESNTQDDVLSVDEPTA